MSREPFNRRWHINDIIQAKDLVSPEKAASIIEKVGLGEPAFPNWLANTRGMEPHEALATWLNFAAYNLRSEETRQSSWSWEQKAERAERAATLAGDLLGLLTDGDRLAGDFGAGSLSDFAALEEDDGEWGYEKVRQSYQGLVQLSHWLALDAKRKRQDASVRQSPPARKGRRKDRAAHRFVDELAEIYRVAWDREPALSRNPETRVVGGPFFRFVSALFPLVIGEEKDSEALASLIRQHTS